MPQNIDIPWILRERTNPTLWSEFKSSARDTYEDFRERRKKMSKKMARRVIDITFDKSSVQVDDYDSTNPEKYDQDLAFASYEPNLRETYYNEKVESAKRLGAMAMVFSGADLAVGVWNDKKLSRQRQKNRREAYIARNGTVKSRMRDRYVKQMNK